MENLPEILAVIIVAISAFYAAVKIFRRYLETKKPFSELPMADGSHFFFGHARLIGTNYQEAFKVLFQQRLNEHGQVGFWLLRFPVVGVTAIEDARAVLAVEHQRNPPWLMRHYLKYFTGEKTLLTINGSAWKFHRSSVARTMNPKFLMASRAAMESVAQSMVLSLKAKMSSPASNSQVFDIEPLMKMVTLDAFGLIALSTDFGLCKTLKPSPLVRAFEYLLNGTMNRIRAPFRPKNLFFSLPFEQNIVHKRERTLIRSFIADMIQQKKEGKGDADDNDLLAHMVRASKNIPVGKLKDDDVNEEAMIDVVMTLLFAGYDTTSVTLTFALYLLAQNPDIQQICMEEIQSVKSCQNVEDLVYTKAVIWESLRLFPAATRTNRSLAKPLELSGGFVAPAGTRIFIPIYSIHHDEKYFPQPEEFRPDRWAKYDDELKCWVEREDFDTTGSIAVGNRKAFLAFSSGGRNCVGQKFATQEAIIVLATLLKGLKFSPVEEYELETTDKDLILKPVNGMPLKVESRD